MLTYLLKEKDNNEVKQMEQDDLSINVFVSPNTKTQDIIRKILEIDGINDVYKFEREFGTYDDDNCNCDHGGENEMDEEQTEGTQEESQKSTDSSSEESSSESSEDKESNEEEKKEESTSE